MEKGLYFNIGDTVVYPQQGIGTINNVVQFERNGNLVDYYEIFIDNESLVFMIPVEKAEGVGLRHLSSENEIDDALEVISHKAPRSSADWKARYQANYQLIKEGSIGSIAKIVHTLYYRSRIKELPLLERKLYDNTLNILIKESALVLHKDKEEIETLIALKLAK